MTDKNNESALLLRMNKQEQVAVLHEIGFTSVNENTPASDIAKYIRWAGGLLDLSFATIRIEDSVNVFFTAEEWNSLSANNRSKYLRIGVRIRADRRQFVIAKSDCIDDIGGRAFKWGAYGTDIRGVKNYGNGNQGLYDTTDGKQNTDAIIEATAGVKDNGGVIGAPAAEAAKNYKACTLEQDGLEDKTEWYLPSEGELIIIAKYKTEINELLSSVSGTQNNLTGDWYWSSTEWDPSSAWSVGMNGGGVGTSIKTNAGRVRPVSATDKPIYDIPLSSIIEAYDDCCKKKRNTDDCIEFSFDYDIGLVGVWESIRYGHYEPDFSKCFMRKKPVLREVFAAAYIDRVVHHWVDIRIDPILEDRFQAQGNVSKNCRIGEGCLSAVTRMDEMIKEVSENYTRDAYIFKGDLKSFFMSMSKSLLWEMIDLFIRDNYKGDDMECLLYLIRVIIFHQPQNKCHRKSPLYLWDELPRDKSLFHSSPDRGIAIGNLPSQKFANFIGSVLDYYVTEICHIKHYVRFVDDFGFIMHDKEDILTNIPIINDFLKEQLLLELHPKKIYVQHYKKGVLFVGAYILPGRIYVSNRVVGNVYNAVNKFNKIAKDGFAEAYIEKFVTTMNSYYGLMRHFNTYNLRRKIGKLINPEWWKYMYIEGHWEVFVIKNEFNFKKQLKKQIRKGNAKKYLTPGIS